MSDEKQQTTPKKVDTRTLRLSVRQELYCQHYARNKIGVKAAAEAGYKQPNTTSITLLKKEKIRKRVDEISQEIFGPKLEEMKKAATTYLLSAVNYTIDGYTNDDGTIKPISEWSQDAKNALDVNIKVEDGVQKVEFKVPNRNKSAETLAKISKLLDPPVIKAEIKVEISRSDAEKELLELEKMEEKGESDKK